MLIKEKPNSPKESLAQEYFSTYGDRIPEEVDQMRALDLAIRVLTMTCCSHRSLNPQEWRLGFEPIDWRRCDSAMEFMRLAIPQANPEQLRLGDYSDGLVFSEIEAVELEIGLGLRLVGTDDLRKHLLLDRESSILFVYHYASFLQESLKESQGDRDSML